MSAPDFSTLFERLPIGAYRSTPQGKQLHANAALVRLNGYDTEAELLAAVADIGREWYVDPKQRERFAQLLEHDGFVVDFVSEIYRHKTRERIWIRENAHRVCNDQGEVLYYEGTVEDITAQRLTQVALEESERRFRALTEKAQVLTVVCDVHGRVSYVSPASELILGKSPQTLRDANVFDWIHPDDLATARAEHAEVVASRNSGSESVARFAHADGSWRHLATLANNCLADSAVGGIVLNCRDVTGRARAEAALQRLADHDALTGLPNRRFLIARATQALAFSVTRSRRLNALLFLDLDNFKSANDLLGHEAGDQLLCAVAERLRGCVRAVDTVARFGGDEFVVLLEDLAVERDTACAQAAAIGHKILSTLGQPHEAFGGGCASMCSVGGTLFGDASEPIADIVRRADRALYAAKHAGRNTLRFG